LKSHAEASVGSGVARVLTGLPVRLLELLGDGGQQAVDRERG
jgi:hypothetical protein